jgi:hypothetical protein
MAKGYRILGMRLVTPQGEIDLVALRGSLLPSSRSSSDAPRRRPCWR